MDAEPGLPLGAVPGLGYTETVHRLEPGATLLLFSDGLVESRTRPVGDGLAELSATLTGAPTTLELDALSDHLIVQLTGGRNDDDLAVLIVSHQPN
jgi:serine/threonine-protein kinase RsbW